MRNRTLINGFIFISSIFLINSSSAETVSLEYKGFYDRLKQVNKQNYPLVELAFSVPITPDCTIVSGSITTESDQYPLTYSKQQRLFIPYDPQLKSDRGLVNIKVAGEAKQCAIAMQVRAKETKQGFTQTELLALTEDMNKLLDGLQGFPMKYFRKPINGLSFEFTDMQNQTVNVVIDDVETIAKEKYTLTVEQINQLKQISFTQKPSIISPLVTQ
ncbi:MULTISPECIES: DUF2987 domain-containing protein [Shewanella]|uniref:DUF2987 domain-containing protein n=1 Tax=Shewanella TaxID=22 RepID=UPI000C510B2D|nr:MULTISPECIES: DUF2987 domain-containing protein [Shewanella]NCQ46136.1 DUF2987 domain-containing protein [Shewanella frigidimarina]NCO70594.1 DUF2987 domain-containing protein [Shewanella vesiculosa]NCP36334.1 DUF2987 domain-containing protein [Shewanella vesiculosa]NCP69615.1 DUF2987 domain-containing protein [Shewanella vesiculosa]NCP75002.1 DUF2987 domain-containing protein [Shewanella vesiculosa]